MIRPIVKDVVFLGEKSEIATKADLSVVEDLIDTLRANLDGCVGMAANMIGYKKRIIIYNAGLMNIVMVNPVITSKSKAYQTEEGCLSHSGKRSVTRYENIEVKYLDERPGDIKHSLADTSKLKEIDFKPDEDKFEEQLRETVKWFSTQME